MPRVPQKGSPSEPSGSYRSAAAFTRKPDLVSLRQPCSEDESIANGSLLEVCKIGPAESASTIINLAQGPFAKTPDLQ